MLTIAIVVSVGALLLGGVLLYNRLVADRNQMRAAWSDIDVQLMRRHDLTPQLVSAVKAYAAHERNTLETITELRARTRAAAGLADRARLEDQLGAQIERLLALQESYPDLKSSENFLQLQRDLVAIEDHLQYARRYYNGSVRQLNTRIEHFPDLIVARLGGFQRGEFFEANAETRSVP